MIHTNEPWAVDPDDRPGMAWNNHIVSADNPNITICFMAHDNTPENIAGEANARRIVACVNACAGIATDVLDEFSKTDRFDGPSYDDLTKQCDDLLAACQGLLKAHRVTVARPPKTVEEAESQLDVIRNAVAAAEAAIASVNADQFRDATKMIDDTSAPAIVFYPAGSLGEAADSEGGEA